MEHKTVIARDGEPSLLESSGLCLLSLDGGGVRGLSALYILKNIMDRMNWEREQSGLPSVKPCEIFDLIGGTSTGGLIAIMLGRLEMSVDDCIEAYTSLAGDVFEAKLSSRPFTKTGNVKARFDSAKLEKAIRQIVTRSGASETELFNDGTKRGCKTFVCTADRGDNQLIIRLRSYSLPDKVDFVHPTICQAALATSAATTFFEPVTIDDRSFADAALGANNPVEEVEGEASNIWCPNLEELKPQVKCFISIGTGHPGQKPHEDKLMNFVSKTLVRIATETEITERKFFARWAKLFDEKRCYRFNVEQGLQDVSMEEFKKKGTVKTATQGYLEHPGQNLRMRGCIQNLRLKQNFTGTSFALDMHMYNSTNKQQSASKPHWIVPFDRNLNFTGRWDLIEKFEAALFAKDQPQKHAIWGLGGIGKTQIVLELVFRLREMHKDCSFIWIPAVNMGTMEKAYQDAAREMQIPGWDDNKADAKKLVQLHLSNSRSGKWLLIFDNADDINMWTARFGSQQDSGTLSQYLPRSEQGSIIFTTRDRKTADTLVRKNVTEVRELEEDVAKELLQKYAGKPGIVHDDQDMRSLVKELTFLPLAIAQAAAFIRQNNVSPAQYRELLAEKEQDVIELLDEEFEDDGRYHNAKNAVAKTWLISFEQIQTRDPLAAEYQSFMACIEPKDIPQSLLPEGSSRMKDLKAIGTLEAYSFITKRATGLSFDMHRLVYLATRGWLKREDRMAGCVEKAIIQLNRVFPVQDDKNRRKWRSYLPHTLSALSFNFFEGGGKERIFLMASHGTCLVKDSRYREAEALLVEATKLHKKMLGLMHPRTSICMIGLADLYYQQGRYKEAEVICLESLSVSTELFGPEAPWTVSMMRQLAMVYISQGHYRLGEVLLLKVLQILERNPQRWQPHILRSMDVLAKAYHDQERFRDAEKIQLRVLEVKKAILGPESPGTANSMCLLASIYRGQSNHKVADALEAQALEIREKVLGPEHARTIGSLNNLAVSYLCQQRWREAEGIFSRVISVSKEIFGPESPETLIATENLAVTYSRQQKWREAEKLELHVLETRRKVLSLDDLSTLESMNHLATIYLSQAQFETAEGLFTQSLEMSRRLLGLENPKTLEIMQNIALTYQCQKRYEIAEDFYTQWLEISTRMLGPTHLDIIEGQQILAHMRKTKSYTEETLELMKEFMKGRAVQSGMGHPNTQAWVNFANRLRKKSERDPLIVNETNEGPEIELEKPTGRIFYVTKGGVCRSIGATDSIETLGLNLELELDVD